MAISMHFIYPGVFTKRFSWQNEFLPCRVDVARKRLFMASVDLNRASAGAVCCIEVFSVSVQKWQVAVQAKAAAFPKPEA
jgi:hypothetical protein